MSIDDYQERPFRVSENEDGVEGDIEPNPFDSGGTETAWIEIVDDETESLRARISVQVQKQNIPHTAFEERVFSEDDILVELLDNDNDESVPAALVEKLLNETDAIQHLQRLCSREDKEDQVIDEDEDDDTVSEDE